MGWFIIKRLGWMLLTLWVVYSVSFFLMRSVPGSPLSAERKVSPEIEQNLKRRYRLDQPLTVQYWDDLRRIVLHGDLGASLKIQDFSVNEIIAQGFPVSASLGILALAFALTLGLTAGVISAVRRGTLADFSMMTIATVGIALPNFVIAGIVIILFVFLWPLFPPGGWGRISNIILPAFCLGAPYAAYIARLTRTGMLDVLGQDYIRTAFAKGLSERTVIMRHALRGALLPVVSFLGPAIAGVLTGSLVVEKIFGIPGLGVHFVNAALQLDYPLAMGLVLLYTTLLYAMNLLVDISYAILDPRVKLS
jgi:ABC-type dipeptide/oligopeptide/nickel transport system permease component